MDENNMEEPNIIQCAVDCTSNPSNFIDNLSNIELLDIEHTVVEMLDDYIQINILQMADPDFHLQLVSTTAEILFTQWSDAGLCSDEDFEDIITFVEQFADNYFDNYLLVEPGIIPPVRSHRTTLILDKNDNIVNNSIDVDYTPLHIYCAVNTKRCKG